MNSGTSVSTFRAWILTSALATLAACGGGGGGGGGSGGNTQVSVPSVVGSTQTAATTAITGAGLTLGTVTTASSATVASGNVISESPAAATSVAKGSSVNLVVSSGPMMVSVPNVVGLTQAAAATAISAAGLTLGNVTMASSATVATGDVISEAPAATASVAVGSTVDIVVSTGAVTAAPTLGGVTIGLASGATVNVMNGADNVPIKVNGAFTLPTPVATGATYAVTLGTQPSNQTCGVQNASGTAATANITNVVVYCTMNVSVASLSGSYDFVGYNMSADLDALFTESFDGAGNRSGTGTTNVGTTITTNVADSGSFTVTANAASVPVLTDSGDNIGGFLGADGSIFTWLANTSNAGQPAIAVGTKPLSTATINDLVGTWVGGALTSASPVYGTVASYTIAADGSVTGSRTDLTASGSISTKQINNPAGTVVVGTGGLITAGGSGGGSGYVSANTDLFVLGYVTGTNNFPGITVGIKQGSGLSVATFSGVYSVVSLVGTAAGNTTTEGAASIVYAHGDGTYTYTYTLNTAGTVTTGTGSGTYAVSATGALTMIDSQADGLATTGQISADGIVIVTGNASSGEVPGLLFGVRL